MLVLARAVTDPDSANLETKFVEDAVLQLLKSRRVLKCSYVYGYYLEETGYKKPIFEFMQVSWVHTVSFEGGFVDWRRERFVSTVEITVREPHKCATSCVFQGEE